MRQSFGRNDHLPVFNMFFHYAKMPGFMDEYVFYFFFFFALYAEIQDGR